MCATLSIIYLVEQSCMRAVEQSDYSLIGVVPYRLGQGAKDCAREKKAHALRTSATVLVSTDARALRPLNNAASDESTTIGGRTVNT